MRIEIGDLVLDHRSQEIALVVSMIRESNGYVEIRSLHNGHLSQVHNKYLSTLKKRGFHERH